MNDNGAICRAINLFPTDGCRCYGPRRLRVNDSSVADDGTLNTVELMGTVLMFLKS